MRTLTRSVLALALMFAGAGFAQAPTQAALAEAALLDSDTTPAYVAASHYAAKFDPGLKSLRFMPLTGGDSIVPVPAQCEGIELAAGVWYVGHGQDGELVLRAPSGTELAADQVAEVAIGVCGAGNADKTRFNVPASAWQFLATNVGALYVGR